MGGKIEEKKKFKHYATGEIIEVSVSDGVGFITGKFFDIVQNNDRTWLKGTSYFEIE